MVTVTPDELNFRHDAMLVHQRLGCRQDSFALVIDSGCGGAMYTIDTARKMIEGGTLRTIAVVASNFTSAFVDRLSMYLFGDGAGAVVLRARRVPS